MLLVCNIPHCAHAYYLLMAVTVISSKFCLYFNCLVSPSCTLLVSTTKNSLSIPSPQCCWTNWAAPAGKCHSCLKKGNLLHAGSGEMTMFQLWQLERFFWVPTRKSNFLFPFFPFCVLISRITLRPSQQMGYGWLVEIQQLKSPTQSWTVKPCLQLL